MKKAEAMTLKAKDRVMISGVGTNHPATVVYVGVEAKYVMVRYDAEIKNGEGPRDLRVSPSRIERFKK